MAAISPKYPLESAQEHIPMCEKHNMNIDITCEDCDEFICSQCAKTDHKDHDWKTIPTAGSLRRRELKKTLSMVKDIDVKEMNEMMQTAIEQMENNQKCCKFEVSKLQKHFKAIVSKLDEIRKNYEKRLRENLESKNSEINDGRLNLEKKKEQIMDVVEFMEEKHSTMSDFSLIDNLRDLTNLLSNRDRGIRILGYPLRYEENLIKEDLLKLMMGDIVDLNDITVIESDSFHIGTKPIDVLAEFDKDILVSIKVGEIELSIKSKGMKKQITSNANDACLKDNADLFFTDFNKKSINRFSIYEVFDVVVPVSESFSTDPLIPYGICQATFNNVLGLLVTLMDDESETYQPNSHSRRLVRHVTLTGDVIREYEYQEDGQTRLFTLPWRVRQNGNTDICIVNRTSKSTSELLILSSSGCLKVVYRGQSLVKKCSFSDVVCDSRSNIIVSDMKNSQIHLLSPGGGFVKYLFAQDVIAHPSSMLLSNSTLLIGNEKGLVKEFVASNMELPTSTLSAENLSRMNTLKLNLSFLSYWSGFRFFKK